LRRLDKEPLRCQNGKLSGGGETAVSLSDVGERPMDRADNFSKEALGLINAGGLLIVGEGHS
jgi:hypothetical protein